MKVQVVVANNYSLCLPLSLRRWPNLTSIFFRWVGEKPPTRGKYSIHEYMEHVLFGFVRKDVSWCFSFYSKLLMVISPILTHLIPFIFGHSNAPAKKWGYIYNSIWKIGGAHLVLPLLTNHLFWAQVQQRHERQGAVHDCKPRQWTLGDQPWPPHDGPGRVGPHLHHQLGAAKENPNDTT